jgi:hypothetical protein
MGHFPWRTVINDRRVFPNFSITAGMINPMFWNWDHDGDYSQSVLAVFCRLVGRGWRMVFISEKKLVETMDQWIGCWENLHETMVFTMTCSGRSCRYSLKLQWSLPQLALLRWWFLVFSQKSTTTGESET